MHKRKIDFVVLEARNRISGRVFSHTIDEPENLGVELGAEWVGASHEKVISLCKEFGLELFNNQMSTHLIYKGEYFKDTEWDYSEDWKNKLAAIFKNIITYHKLIKTYWIKWIGGDTCR